MGSESRAATGAERFMEKLTWAELEDRIQAGIDAVLLPIGTKKQHGRHMPLNSDCVIARALCDRAARAAEPAPSTGSPTTRTSTT